MYKKIFVAIDSSSTARKALDEAIALFGTNMARLPVNFVAAEAGLTQHGMGLGSDIDVPKVKADIRAGAQQMLDEAVQRASAAGFACEPLLIEFSNRCAADAIAHAAESQGADLLVLAHTACEASSTCWWAAWPRCQRAST